MKSQKWGLLVILVLAVIWLPISISGNGESQAEQDLTRLLSIMKADESAAANIGEKLEDAKKSLAQQIAADFEAMRYFLEKKDFCCLAKLMEKRGVVIITPAYKKIWGGSSAEFWKNAWSDEAKIKLIPIHIQISGALGKQLVPFCDLLDEGVTVTEWMKKSPQYNAVAVLVFEFHIVTKSGGTTVHNATGGADASYIHKTGCPWG